MTKLALHCDLTAAIAGCQAGSRDVRYASIARKGDQKVYISSFLTVHIAGLATSRMQSHRCSYSPSCVDTPRAGPPHLFISCIRQPPYCPAAACLVERNTNPIPPTLDSSSSPALVPCCVNQFPAWRRSSLKIPSIFIASSRGIGFPRSWLDVSSRLRIFTSRFFISWSPTTGKVLVNCAPPET